MTILKRLLSSILFLACVPFVFLGAVAIGLWAIWTKPTEKAMDKIADPGGTIEKPFNWNRVPLGREDKGGTC